MSIRLRLTLWYSGLLAVALIAFGIIVYNAVQKNTLEDLQKRLTDETGRITVYVTPDGDVINAVPRQGFDANLIAWQLVNYSQNYDGIVTRRSANLQTSQISLSYPDFAKAGSKPRFVR